MSLAIFSIFCCWASVAEASCARAEETERPRSKAGAIRATRGCENMIETSVLFVGMLSGLPNQDIVTQISLSNSLGIVATESRPQRPNRAEEDKYAAT